MGKLSHSLSLSDCRDRWDQANNLTEVRGVSLQRMTTMQVLRANNTVRSNRVDSLASATSEKSRAVSPYEQREAHRTGRVGNIKLTPKDSIPKKENHQEREEKSPVDKAPEETKTESVAKPRMMRSLTLKHFNNSRLPRKQPSTRSDPGFPQHPELNKERPITPNRCADDLESLGGATIRSDKGMISYL